MAPSERAEGGDVVEVRGTREMKLQAEAGLKLFKEVRELQGDSQAAEAWKAEEDSKIKTLEAEADALTGAENKKARQAKSKEAAALKKTDQYIDAELVLKGKAPKHGFFLVAGQEVLEEAPKAMASGGYTAASAPVSTPDAKAEAKPAARREERRSAKKDTSGLSKDEQKELEQLKNDIIHRKAELKGDGLTSGQINKDESIVLWVARMNALREKENPGSTGAGKKDSAKEKGAKLSAESEAEAIKLAQDIDEYRQRLVDEFKYNKKEIAADPDMIDMTARLKRLQSRRH